MTAVVLLVTEGRSHSTNNGRLPAHSQVYTARLHECWRLQNDVHYLQECQALSHLKCIVQPPWGVNANHSRQDWSVEM